jgi:hypothetical protein
LANEFEVEKLCQKSVARRFDDMHSADDLNEHLFDDGKPTRDLRMLEVVAEHEYLKDLASDIAVLTPSCDFIVGEFWNLIREGCNLCVLVELRLPKFGCGTTWPVAAINDREGSPELTSKPTSKVLFGD